MLNPIFVLALGQYFQCQWHNNEMDIPVAATDCSVLCIMKMIYSGLWPGGLREFYSQYWLDPIQPGVLRGGVPLWLSGAAGTINRDVYSSHIIHVIRALLSILFNLISFQNQTKFSNLNWRSRGQNNIWTIFDLDHYIRGLAAGSWPTSVSI